MTTSHRAIATAVALFAAAICLIVCHRKVKTGKARVVWAILGGYNLVLLSAFIFGVVTDDGFGWAFLPLMVLTAPWSFLVAARFSEMLDKMGLGIGPFLMNFLVSVVVCGGLNMLVLYFFIRKIAYPEDRPRIT